MSRPARTVTNAFTSSLNDAELYPQNLVETIAYSATLRAYHRRLEKTAAKLFVTDLTRPEVAFRDFDESTSKFVRKKVRSLQELQDQLGVRQNAVGQRTFDKKDPKCRFVFIYGDHSRASLRVTKRMAVELLSFHQVMPAYLDFMLLFGQSSGPNDMKFSGFREQTCLKAAPNNAPSMSDLGRHGRYFEIAYNMKTVQFKEPDNDSSWSVRQAGLYHAFDVIEGTALWLITKGLNLDDRSHDIKDRTEEMTGISGREEDRKYDTPENAFRSSLAMHALMIHWATESWRWYLQWLDQRIEAETEQAVFGTRDRDDPARRWYTGEDLQRVQVLEDAVNEANRAVDGNMEVMSAIQAFYDSVIQHQDWPLASSCAEYNKSFSKQTNNAIYDLRMQSSRARALAQHTVERKHLVLQYIQTQTAEKMEDLTKCTYSVAVSAQKETIVMRIITAVTLIYLPATFVSVGFSVGTLYELVTNDAWTFFSTDVVKYQTGDAVSGSAISPDVPTPSFSVLAMHRWLQVSLPLTAITLLAAFLAYLWAKNRQDKHNSAVLDELKLV